MKGYKVFNSDWTCRGFKFEVGKVFETELPTRICDNGFHYCTKASDCFNYYGFDSKNKVAEIEAIGVIDSKECEDTKHCTSKIHIIREITWQELLTIVNEGKDNTGLCNTGDWNTGDRNTGNGNTGNLNTGNGNTGDRNTGNRNTGDRNTGDWNTVNYSSGVFCTEPQKAIIFDKPSNLSLQNWWNSDARYLLNRIQTISWVYTKNMTDQEKTLHPEHEITGGFLKVIHIVEAAEKWWSKLSNCDKDTVKSIPNFDSDKFYKITGIKV